MNRIVLLGTGEFALPTFRALMEDAAPEVAAVFTQPDRTGRGHHRHVNKVKELAQQHDIPVRQPQNVNDAESLEFLRSLNADLYVVAAYGQLLKPAFLEIPRLGAFNLHGSLLPAHRGAAPVQYSVWKGDAVGGVTMFQIEPSLDSGPIVGTVKTEIGQRETSGELMQRLAELSVELTRTTVDALLNGSATFEIQDHAAATRAPKIQKADGIIDWNQSAVEVDCQVRAMQPWPRASSSLQLPDRKPLRCLLLDVTPLPDRTSKPGEVTVEGKDLFIGTSGGSVRVNLLQPEGKRAQMPQELINGYGVSTGAMFGH